MAPGGEQLKGALPGGVARHVGRAHAAGPNTVQVTMPAVNRA